ncbi:putative Protein arginine N-methyltransferase 1 [Blattamonas nauphoetae]|uniref:Methyltransferase domain-containing protein n=1 Tax=Blattamonas nauphoetae TaxID=2049346 RepID=A0ABQ9X933_9EUKA|nr:putative Protein arginine N-methyltransferase 1 [Blattamonas nauphoetae]
MEKDSTTECSNPDSASSTTQASAKTPSTAEKPLLSAEKTSSDYYFESYSHFGIHEEMLKDAHRTGTYRDSILQNKHLFQGKVVLDVGCGTGILSMFAVQAGAAKVYAVDSSDIIDFARSIIEENGLSEKIELIKGKVEEIDLPVEKVDILISEWMGYCLLYENMLETVLVARDRWLDKTTGIMLPDWASLYIVGIEDFEYRASKIDFWDNVYGFKMSCLKREALAEPLVDVCDAEQTMTSSACVCELDLLSITKEDLAFTSQYEITAERDDTIHALVAFFDTDFSFGQKRSGNPLKTRSRISRDDPTQPRQYRLTTSPWTKPTHWKQTVFYLPNPCDLKQGEIMQGTFALKPNDKNPREMDIDIVFRHTRRLSDDTDETLSSQTVPYKLR